MIKLFIILTGLCLSGCATTHQKNDWTPPQLAESPIKSVLENTPKLDGKKITVAVYSFNDRTGQRKPSANFSQLSSAITQGSDMWLINALKDVGDGSWFTVIERIGLDNLVKERQLIKSTREVYDGKQAPKLKPLLFAGLIIEGGVVSYESNIESGGMGARYFGLGANTQYQIHEVTVAMRLISVQTGEILLSVATEKRIASYKTSADFFKFIDFGTKSLEVEVGSAVNEPVNYAVRSTIEQGVIELIYEGEKKKLWNFKGENK